MAKEIITVPDLSVCPFPRSLAIKTDELLWIGGQLATDYQSGLALYFATWRKSCRQEAVA